MKAKLIPVALIGLLFIGSEATADEKTYPGYACLTHNEDVKRSGSRFRNEDPNAEHTVACPIVRDRMIYGMNSAEVEVMDNSNADDVSCTITMKQPRGGSVDFDTQTSSFTGPSTLSFGSLSNFTDGHYTLYCTLPASDVAGHSAVISYWIDE